MKTSDRIEFDKEIGVHKTYKGFKWQPDFGGTMVTFIRPGKRTMEWVKTGTLENFFKMIDGGKL